MSKVSGDTKTCNCKTSRSRQDEKSDWKSLFTTRYSLECMRDRWFSKHGPWTKSVRPQRDNPLAHEETGALRDRRKLNPAGRYTRAGSKANTCIDADKQRKPTCQGTKHLDGKVNIIWVNEAFQRHGIVHSLLDKINRVRVPGLLLCSRPPSGGNSYHKGTQGDVADMLPKDRVEGKSDQ